MRFAQHVLFFECWPNTNIGNTTSPFLRRGRAIININFDSVNAKGRMLQGFKRDISCRKANLAATLITLDHRACHRPVTSKHRGGGHWIARLQRRADAA